MNRSQELVYEIFDTSITEDELVINDDSTGSQSFGTSGGISAQLNVHSTDFYRQLLFYKSLGLADAFIKGDVDSEEISNVTAVIVKNRLEQAVKSNWRLVANLAWNDVKNRPISLGRAKKNTQHYNLGNDFYKLWLDPTMTYTCGIAPDDNQEATLEEMQYYKHDRICQKLDLQPGDRLLDVGCGWGAMLRHAVKHYGVKAVGITLSAEQQALALEMNQEQGLSENIDIQLQDYREFTPEQKFDKFVSIGMFEAVGKNQINSFTNMIPQVLKQDGLGLIHTLTTNNGKRSDPFLERDIFPGGYLWKCFEILEALTKRGYRCLHFEDFKTHYANTLNYWDNNLTDREQDVLDLGGKFNYEMIRRYHIYLRYCEAGLRHGEPSLNQFLISANPTHQQSVHFIT